MSVKKSKRGGVKQREKRRVAAEEAAINGGAEVELVKVKKGKNNGVDKDGRRRGDNKIMPAVESAEVVNQ